MSFTNNNNPTFSFQAEKPSRHNQGGRLSHRQSASVSALPAHMSLNVPAASGAHVDGGLKSPRSQLLDRIRTTPRTSNFVPGGAAGGETTDRLSAVQEQSSSGRNEPAGQRRHQRSVSQQQPPHGRRPASNSSTNSGASSGNQLALPSHQHQHRRTNSRAASAGNADHAEQLAALEMQKQQLIMQNMILAQQQQLVMRQMQDGGLGSTPPYTPTASPNHGHVGAYIGGAAGTASDGFIYPTATQLFYDTNSGQYIQALYDENNVPHYMPAQPEQVAAFQAQQQRLYLQSLHQTTPQQSEKSMHSRHRSTGMMTPDSIDRSLSQQSHSQSVLPLQKQRQQQALAQSGDSERPQRRAQTPPSKDGQPVRQPKGPPTIDVLMAAVEAQKQLEEVTKQQAESDEQPQLLQVNDVAAAAAAAAAAASLGIDQATMLRAQQALLTQQIDASPNFQARRRLRAKQVLASTLGRRTTPSPPQQQSSIDNVVERVESLQINPAPALAL